MEKRILFIVITSFIFFNSNGQITKGNWLVGGNAAFSNVSKDINSVSGAVKTINLQLAPSVSYFLADKFSLGIKLSYIHDRTDFINTNNMGAIVNTYSIGPTIRYYFLSQEKPFNLFMEGNYQHGWSRQIVTGLNPSYDIYDVNNISFFGGAALFFNSSVALEFAAGYSQLIYNVNEKDKSILVSVGFQIHLIK